MTIKNQIQKALGEKAKKSVQDFAEAFFETLADDDVASLPADRIRQIVLTHADLMAKRRKGQVKIAFGDNARPGMVWEDRRTYLDIVCDDMAFLIDSVIAALNAENYQIDLPLHPSLHINFEEGVAKLSSKGNVRQAHIHVAIQGTLIPEQRQVLEEDLRSVIEDVRLATHDWQAMRVRAIEAKQAVAEAQEFFSAAEVNEYSDFLDYLYDNNFTFLGYREYKFQRKDGKLVSQIIPGRGLGVLADEKSPAYISETKQPLPSAFQELRLQLPPLHVSKVNRVSTVHRRVPLDAVTVRLYNDKGDVTGELLFVGLFTSVTYSRSLRSIPLLNMKAEQVVKKLGFEPSSHNGRALRHILEKYPRDELFQVDTKDLVQFCQSILKLQESPRIALYCRKDPFSRYVSCLVYIPRERYDTALRLKFRDILEQELGGVCSNYSSTVDDSPLVRILYVITVSQQQPKSFNAPKVERMLQTAGRVWGDALADTLHHEISDDFEATRLSHAYRDAFSADYRNTYSLPEAVHDITKIETVLASGAMALDLKAAGAQLDLKLYTSDKALVLSDILPILENMGLRVLTENTFSALPSKAESSVVIQHYQLALGQGSEGADVPGRKALFEEAFVAIQRGDAENDTLNSMVLRAGLSCRDVTILRTYVRYLRQSTLPFSLAYMEQAVVAYPSLAGLLVQVFKAKFALKGDQDKQLATLDRQISAGLDAVTSLDHDRIWRALRDVLNASVRTNYFQVDANQKPKPYLSIKIDSGKLDFLPNPKPYREIFVYSARMEGIHLRAGKIARGGIRWSDRHEDFRTEVLGLMKAQTVKNSVIVPTGAKGGFIVKRPPQTGGRPALQQEGIECYRYLVRGMLDLTDNLNKAGKVVRPAHVRALDEEDPYIVAAADKGTASFSDIANALSAEYNFWLADAFASGGSAGYDHKKMGITSRGAWESVKRHFRELNHDTQTQPFDVVGVGDMAGDVFGNGMLQSHQIRMVGVFNHVHIVCDPEPDVAQSYAERKRLFDNVLGWDSYDAKKLSKGGRIYSRSEKVLDLTPEIQKRFDIQKSRVSPPELIQALLKARTDLLFFGGIGVFVKATTEVDAEVGDRSNDALRVNATDLRAKVVGEGANLAVTQRARVQYAQAGGAINADFIDNSAGVDTSDHEVNIKILLSSVTAKSPSALSRPARDKLLKEMTNEIGSLVVRDNYQQVQALSLLEMQSGELLVKHQRYIQDLEREGLLNRALEFLPDDKTIAQRLKDGKGLSRPELAILLSYAKIRATTDLLETDIPDQKNLDSWVIQYFPAVLQKKYTKEITKHPLRRELVSTLVISDLVNRLGPTFIRSKMHDLSVDVAAVVRAYLAALEIFCLPDLWAEIESLDGKIPASVQLRAFYELQELLEDVIAWILTTFGADFTIDSLIKRYQAPLAELRKCLVTDQHVTRFLTQTQILAMKQRMRTWSGDAVSADLSRLLALRAKLSLMPTVAQLAFDLKKPLAMVASVYYPLGDVFAFSWMRQQIGYLPKADRWAREATESFETQINRCQMRLTRVIIENGKGPRPYEQWLETHRATAEEIFRLLDDLRRNGINDLMPLTVVMQRIERLL